ncbi:MAG: ATP synthase F1 subunit gamma [Flavobacteriaceae bacterium]|nr:ATP synthase F1 subunit gamma [Flavobacteriaceae bacterium]
MANLKEVRIRIKSVSSTQQITKAMKLVSANKLRKAQTAIVQMRPYANKLKGIMQNLSDSIDSPELSAFFETREPKKILQVLVTSDRGLCGAFNANVGKTVRTALNGKYKAQWDAGNVHLLFIGKKGFEFFNKYKNLKLDTEYRDAFQNLNAETVFACGDRIMQQFKNKEYDVVEVVYNQFKNAATQILVTEQLLPVVKPASETKATTQNDYIFEPSKPEILLELIPRSIKTQLYKACLDSFASEHGARMVAMDKATENAGDLLNALKLSYNQARQAAITKELSEIVGGAAAMAG